MRRRLTAGLLLLSALGACADSNPPASQRFLVFFQEWSASLDENAHNAIDAAARWAAQHPAETVTVTGFAAPDGSPEANAALSRTRAEVVVDQLQRDGVANNRIRLTAKGPTDFTLAPQESRRVEIGVAGR